MPGCYIQVEQGSRGSFDVILQGTAAHGLTLLFSYTAGKLMSDALQVPQSDFGENSGHGFLQDCWILLVGALP